MHKHQKLTSARWRFSNTGRNSRRLLAGREHVSYLRRLVDFAKYETFIPPIMRRRREITARAMSDKRMNGETLSTLAMQNNVYGMTSHSHAARFFPRGLGLQRWRFIKLINWQKFNCQLESYTSHYCLVIQMSSFRKRLTLQRFKTVLEIFATNMQQRILNEVLDKNIIKNQC